MSVSDLVEPEQDSCFLRPASDQKPHRSLSVWLIGRPLATAEMPHQTISKVVGLAVFASDAMSSVAYAPQEMMLVLALAGDRGPSPTSLPLAIAIVGLLPILTISYEQTIHAYPGGGGAYIVARDNLGELPATDGRPRRSDRLHPDGRRLGFIRRGPDYLRFPGALRLSCGICRRLVLFVMIVNLRGVQESGAFFAVPTYFFIGMMF